MITQTADVNKQSCLSCSVVILVVLIFVMVYYGGLTPGGLSFLEQVAVAQMFILGLGLSAIALAILKLSYRED